MRIRLSVQLVRFVWFHCLACPCCRLRSEVAVSSCRAPFGALLVALLRNLRARFAGLVQRNGDRLLTRLAMFRFGLDVMRDGFLGCSSFQRHDLLPSVDALIGTQRAGWPASAAITATTQTTIQTQHATCHMACCARPASTERGLAASRGSIGGKQALLLRDALLRRQL